MILMKSKK